MSLFARRLGGAARRADAPVEPPLVGAQLPPVEELCVFSPAGRASHARSAERAVSVLAVVGVALLAPNTAMPLSASRQPTIGQTVRVDAGQPLEFAFTLSTNRVHAGTVIFVVRNAGRIPHDFEIRGIRTRAIPPGGTATLTVGFREPGVYHYVCTLPGQELAGMVGYLVVTATITDRA
jgi:uncharacterized cupredoxin-like copper-binding protein